MAYSIPTIANLKAQLIEKISALDCIKTRGRDYFSLDDYGPQIDLATMPTFGVAYAGASKIENEASSTDKGSASAMLHSLYFDVAVAVEYTGGEGQLSVPVATDVLNNIRREVYGFRGIGSRPWMFLSESPFKYLGDNKVYYIQHWKIDVPLIGTSTN